MIPGGLPPLNFNSTAASSAKGAEGTMFGGAASDGGAMNINYGSGVSQGGGVPTVALYAGLALAGLWAWKRYS